MEFGFSDYFVLGEVISAVLSLILLCNILITFSFYDKKQRYFLLCVIATFFSSIFDIASVYCIENYSKIPLFICELSSTIYFLSLMSIPFFILHYGLNVILSNKPKSKKILTYAINTMYVLYFLLIIINIFTGWIFKFDKTQGYIRGPLKNLTYIYSAITTLFLVSIAVKNRAAMVFKVFLVFILYPIISFSLLIIQFFNGYILVTGISAFASLFFAYIAIQSDLIDFDSNTGLMTENKLIKYFDSKKVKGVIYFFSIENMNYIQSNLDISKKNQLLLTISKELTKHFEKNTFLLSTSSFATLGKTEDEIKTKIALFEKFIQKLPFNTNIGLPTPLDYYSAAITFTQNESYENLINIAHTMIRKAKRQGIHSLQFCDSTILIDIARRKQIFTILKRELNVDSQQFQVYFQPIYSIKEKRITHLEALARLVNTELNNISPSEFVPIAESKGLIEKLGMIIFEKVCKFVSENKDTIKTVSVNFSVYQMSNINLVDNVLKTIKKYKLTPKNLILEITESIFIDNYDVVLQNMLKLTKEGIEFYLDDFGTGYSNLSNVVQLPFSTIKMDRSFVLMIEEDTKKGLSLFRNLIETFKGAGLEVLVEGVETENQRDLVTKSGCDFIQGFLYSRPLDPSSCIRFMKKQV